MNMIKFSKVVMAALPLFVVLGMVPSVASAHDPGFVHNASGTFTGNGVGGCLHTTRWTPEMGECGEAGSGNDSDGDGVTDDKDRCPDTPAGVPVNEDGCSIDSDGDGVADYKDNCPGTPAGVAVNENGCGPDSDGDGVADHEDDCPGTARGARVDTRGCELATRIDVQGVHFDFDRATLKDSAKTILDDAAAQINRHASKVKSVDVTGHTDSTGPEAYNQALSERRANSVKSYLEGKGISGINARGEGESNPAADNGTREGRAMNRRVEIKVNM